MGMKKHFIEIYKYYKIYIVSGIKTALFIAEKNDPAKGATLVADTLAELKRNIDKNSEYALSIRINIREGNECNKIIQKVDTNIKLHGIKYKSISVVVNSDYDAEYDYDFIFDMYLKNRARVSKKHKKRGKHPNIKDLMILHTCVVYER